MKTSRWKVTSRLTALVALAAVAFAPLMANAEEETPTEPFRPGEPSTTGVRLPDDLTMEVDGKTVPHPCAGRKLLYQAHIDTAYLTRHNGKLEMMTVDGSQVGPSDDYCMRLAPDGVGGREVSRMVVPNDPKLSFLGQPGRILWQAPMNREDGWRPIWAGFGAFDAAHEWKVPTDFVGDLVTLNIVDFKGPGDMEVFNYFPGWAKADRRFSSREIRSSLFGVGGHSHINWTFSDAGIYELTWVGEGKHYDGTIEKSDPTTQYWLVGSDEEVGLPPGTTKGLNGFTYTAEDMRADMGLSAPEDPAPTPLPRPDERYALDEEEMKKAVEDAWLSDLDNVTIRSGVNWYRAKLAPETYDFKLTGRSDDDSKDYSGYPIVEVPDATLRCIAADDPYLGWFSRHSGGGWAWVTPKVGNDQAPSFGYDFTGLDFSPLSEKRVTAIYSPDNPEGAEFFAGIDEGNGLAPLSGAQNAFSKPIQMLEPTKYPVQYGFTKPGLYAVSLDPRANLPGGSVASGYNSIYFAVGNETINYLRSKENPDAQLLEVGAKYDCAGRELTGADPSQFPVKDLHPTTDPTDDPSTEPSPDPSEDPTPVPSPDPTPVPSPDPTPVPSPDPTPVPSPDPTPVPSPDPTPVPSPDPTPVPSPVPSPDPTPVPSPDPAPEAPAVDPLTRDAITAINQLWAQAMPNHVVRDGHMDLALASESGLAQTYLKDGSVPSAEVKRPSGTFTFAVPKRAFQAAPPSLANYAADFANGAFTLPQTQDPNLPWLGFSTEALDYAGVAPDTPITVSLANFQGPGRMVTGHMGLTGEVTPALDSADPNSKLVYDAPAHDHQFFWFTKPGVYAMDFLYTWTSSDGQTQQLPLTSYFLVGDKAVEVGSQAVNTQTLPTTLPAEPAQPPQPEPSEPPATDPTNPPAPAPDDGQPGDGNPGEGQPGDGQPGDQNPGDQSPGDQNPGDGQPADENPGDQNPGDQNPGNEQPGDEKPGTDKPGTEKPGTGAPTKPAPQNPAPSQPDTARIDGLLNTVKNLTEQLRREQEAAKAPAAAPNVVTATVPAPTSFQAPPASAPLGIAPLASGGSTSSDEPAAEATASPAPTATDAPLALGSKSDTAETTEKVMADNGPLVAGTPWYQGTWLSGFIFGIGIMSLIGGVALLIAARKSS